MGHVEGMLVGIHANDDVYRPSDGNGNQEKERLYTLSFWSRIPVRARRRRCRKVWIVGVSHHNGDRVVAARVLARYLRRSDTLEPFLKIAKVVLQGSHGAPMMMMQQFCLCQPKLPSLLHKHCQADKQRHPAAILRAHHGREPHQQRRPSSAMPFAFSRPRWSPTSDSPAIPITKISPDESTTWSRGPRGEVTAVLAGLSD